MEGLANTQADMAKAIMFNGYLFQMFMSQQRAKSGRSSARREERSIEGRGRSYAGGGFGGGGRRGGGGRGMINVTPSGGSGGSGKPGGGGGRGGFGVNDIISFASGGGALQYAEGATTKIPKVIESITTATPFSKTSSQTLTQILAGNSDVIAGNVTKRVGANPNIIRGIGKYISSNIPLLKRGGKLSEEAMGLGNTITQAKLLLGSGADDASVLLMSKALGSGSLGANSTALREAMTRHFAATRAMKSGKGAANMMDTMYGIGKMTADDQLMMMTKFGDDAERLMSLGFANPRSRIIQQYLKNFLALSLLILCKQLQ